MEVILIERMSNLGNVGDTVKVRDGYGRNFLIPQGKALRATKANVELFAQKRAEIEARNAELRAQAEKLAKAVNGQSVVIVRQAGEDGRLYGSVSARDIADALKAKNFEVERQHIALQSIIKEIGISTVKLALYADVSAEVKVNVARSELEAQAAGKADAKAKAKEEAEVNADDAA